MQTIGNMNPILTRDGRERLIEWYDSELRDQHGNSLGLLSIGMDVTEKQQLRLEADTHRENLAHLVRIVTLNELASGLAHELSQPLTAIIQLHTGNAASPAGRQHGHGRHPPRPGADTGPESAGC